MAGLRQQATGRMPENACQHGYVCGGCGAMLRPKSGDCCVFCSYADTLCPPVQKARSGGRGVSVARGGGGRSRRGFSAQPGGAEDVWDCWQDRAGLERDPFFSLYLKSGLADRGAGVAGAVAAA